jgi:hypothetical protein
VLEKDLRYLSYGLYGFVYVLVLVPARIYAGITIKDITWGTSSRNAILNTASLGHYFLYSWFFLLTIGLMLKYILLAQQWDFTNILMFSLFSVFIVFQYAGIRFNIFV